MLVPSATVRPSGPNDVLVALAGVLPIPIGRMWPSGRPRPHRTRGRRSLPL